MSSTDHGVTREGLAIAAARGARVIRDLTEKNASSETELVQLRAKCASYERNDRVRALAAQMDERGLSPELSLAEKVASISQYPDLDRVEDAIKLAGGGKLDLPRVSEEPGSGTQVDSAASFREFCLTGRGAKD